MRHYPTVWRDAASRRKRCLRAGGQSCYSWRWTLGAGEKGCWDVGWGRHGNCTADLNNRWVKVTWGQF